MMRQALGEGRFPCSMDLEERHHSVLLEVPTLDAHGLEDTLLATNWMLHLDPMHHSCSCTHQLLVFACTLTLLRVNCWKIN